MQAGSLISCIHNKQLLNRNKYPIIINIYTLRNLGKVTEKLSDPFSQIWSDPISLLREYLKFYKCLP